MISSKVVKKKYIIGSVIIIILIAGYFFYQNKKDSFLNHQLPQKVADKSNNLYKISYDFIVVDEIAGNLYIKNLVVKGDTTVQLQMLKNGDTTATKTLIEAHIPILKVAHFKTAKALLSKKLECEYIVIDNPTVTILLFPGQIKKVDQKKQQQEIYKQLLGNFNLIKADSIAINNASVLGRDYYSGETKFKAGNTFVALNNVQIDSTANYDTTRTFFCQNISVHAKTLALGEPETSASVKDFAFDTRSKIVTVASFSYDALKNSNFSTTLEGISIKGISYTGPIENSDLTISEIELQRGNIETHKSRSQQKEKTSKSKQPLLNGWVKSFALNSLKIHSFKFTTVSASAGASSITVNNNSLQLKKLYIDKTDYLNGALIDRADEIIVSNKLISFTNDKGLYKTNIEGLLVNTKTKKITVSAIKMLPLLSEVAFAKKIGKQTDRYDMAIKNVSCNNVDFKKLIDGEIDIASVSTANSSFKVYRDMNFPIDSSAKEKKRYTFPHQMLFDADVPINIQKFVASNTYIEYKEKNAKSKNTGRLTFTNATIRVADITNKSNRKSNQIPLTFSANLLNKVPVSAKIIFYTSDWKKGKFSVELNENKNFEATILNELT